MPGDSKASRHFFPKLGTQQLARSSGYGGRLSSLLFLFHLCHMVADYAASHDTRHGMMAHCMAHDAPYHRAFDATLCVSRASACHQQPGQHDSNQFLVHSLRYYQMAQLSFDKYSRFADKRRIHSDSELSNIVFIPLLNHLCQKNDVNVSIV
jgi:hypothetical protein